MAQPFPPSPCGRVPTQNAAAFCVGPGGGDGSGVWLLCLVNYWK
nr:MAG TPA: hypothetical protein [Caudoviricetes sp.]